MAKAREILFRIFYSVTFTVAFLLLVAFCATTPADCLYQSYKRDRLVDIFFITGAFVITALIAIFLYASRLYTNRSILRDIPKTYLPIEKEDLPGKRVHRLIEECLARSAVVAYHAKPRSRRMEVEVPYAGQRILAISRQTKLHHHEHHLTEHEQHLLSPKWGHVAHPGWQSPAAEDIPNLEFASVVGELIDLVEAKAVSLAPSDPTATPNGDGSAPPDPRILELLTRPNAAGMREYLSILVEFGVIPEGQLSEEFLLSYERARFGAAPPSERDFKQLMRMFAELLRSMKAMDVDLLDLGPEYHDHDHSVQYQPGNKSLATDDDAQSTFSASSILRKSSQPRRMSEDSVPSMSEDEDEMDIQSLRTAPSYARSQPMSRTGTDQDNSRSRSRPGIGARFFSAESSTSLARRARDEQGRRDVESGRPSVRRQESEMSAQSARSRRSQRSQRSRRSQSSEASNGTGGSVIRLAEATDEGELPYTIEIPPVTQGRGR